MRKQTSPGSRRLLTAAMLAGCAAGMLAGPAVAHHGWGSYDSGQVLNLTGTIAEASYANPHGMLHLSVEDGKTWHVILAPPYRMQSRGLPAEALSPGQTVTVVGYPHKSEADELRAERITVDGKTIELR